MSIGAADFPEPIRSSGPSAQPAVLLRGIRAPCAPRKQSRRALRPRLETPSLVTPLACFCRKQALPVVPTIYSLPRLCHWKMKQFRQPPPKFPGNYATQLQSAHNKQFGSTSNTQDLHVSTYDISILETKKTGGIFPLFLSGGGSDLFFHVLTAEPKCALPTRTHPLTGVPQTLSTIFFSILCAGAAQ